MHVRIPQALVVEGIIGIDAALRLKLPGGLIEIRFLQGDFAQHEMRQGKVA